MPYIQIIYKILTILPTNFITHVNTHFFDVGHDLGSIALGLRRVHITNEYIGVGDAIIADFKVSKYELEPKKDV